MDRRIVLLRGINVGGRNRLPMADLRGALSSAGFAGVRTHLQSGNVVVDGDDPPVEVARACSRVVAERFGLRIPVVVRTGGELADVVRRNPLADVASDPRRYQVSFLDGELAPDVAASLVPAGA